MERDGGGGTSVFSDLEHGLAIGVLGNWMPPLCSPGISVVARVAE